MGENLRDLKESISAPRYGGLGEEDILLLLVDKGGE